MIKSNFFIHIFYIKVNYEEKKIYNNPIQIKTNDYTIE